MFGKNKTKQKEVEMDPQLAGQIHVMPQRFYVAPKKKKTGLLIIIIIGVLLIGGLIAVGAYLISNSAPAPTPVINQNLPVNTNTEPVNVNLNQNSNENINNNANTNANDNTNVNANLNLNTNTNSNINTNINTDRLVPLPSAPDTDNDGLTAEEEKLYGTNADKADTDSDGYTDGAEILNGYDPTKSNALLSNSGLFVSYNHPLYSIIYPKSWTVKEQDVQKAEVLFAAGTGEFVEILAVSNVSALSLEDWYSKQFPNVKTDQLTAVKINNATGFRDASNLNYYLINPNNNNNIFIITYNVGNLTQTNFATTFNAMVKNFRLTQ